MARTEGLNLIEKLNDGRLELAPSAFLERTREDIVTAIEELLEVGARIRPLCIGKLRVGRVRGVHLSERRTLKRLITNDIEFVEILLSMATTLSREEIQQLSLLELRTLSRLVKAMSDSDLELYAYISAFVTTSQSEQLWYSQGTTLSSFRNRVIPMPDGKQNTVTTPSEQTRLWAILSRYRTQAQQRLDACLADPELRG